MKAHYIAAGFLGFVCSISAAHADNVNVEAALKERPELSIFYKALMASGVNHDLNSGRAYTIFAPTNDAFSRLGQKEYACFYTAECPELVAEIVRNHIIPGEVYIGDATDRVGGFYSIGRFVDVGELFRNDYAVDSHYSLDMWQIPGGVLYEIDGVIANPGELELLHEVSQPPEQTTSVSQKTIHDPRCKPDGCADEVTQTTIITRKIATDPDTEEPDITDPPSE